MSYRGQARLATTKKAVRTTTALFLHPTHVAFPRSPGQYKGSGTINGTGNYGFKLTAIDGDISGGGGIDKFRIKIWDKNNGAIVYDNQMGAGIDDIPTTVLSGGSIVIHK